MTQLLIGLLIGIACTAAIAAIFAAARMRLLAFHAVREWRTPVLICGEWFFIVPEREYQQLDSIRIKTLAAVRAFRPAPFLASARDIPGGPEHDMDCRGGPAVPGR